jgi:hypothetical protein
MLASVNASVNREVIDDIRSSGAGASNQPDIPIGSFGIAWPVEHRLWIIMFGIPCLVKQAFED